MGVHGIAAEREYLVSTAAAQRESTNRRQGESVSAFRLEFSQGCAEPSIFLGVQGTIFAPRLGPLESSNRIVRPQTRST